MVFTNNCSYTDMNRGFTPANYVGQSSTEETASLNDEPPIANPETPTAPAPIPVPTAQTEIINEERLFYISPTGDDSNEGSQKFPWKTFAKAARTLSAGETVLVMDGTYTEPEVLFKKSGTETQPITIRAQNRHKAILSSTSGCSPNISIYASYVVIQGIRSGISSSNTPCPSHNSADGTGVRCWHASASTPANPSTGHKGCIVRDVLFDASPARSHAVKSSQDYAIVEQCTSYSGFEALNNYGNIFRNNLVIGGDAWGSSLLAKGGARNFEAYNNVVYIKSVWGKGIILGGSTGTQWLYDPPSGIEAYNSIAYNNVIINESGGVAESLGMMGAKDSFIFNNVVIGGFLTIAPGYAGIPSVSPTVKNNIFMCSGNNISYQMKYTGSLNLDYNNFFKCTNSPTQAHSISGDPLFIDIKSDWHLNAGSPAINSGSPVTATGFNGEQFKINLDQNGKERKFQWDLGVYELD